MNGKRAPSFPRQILICLTFSLLAILFALSCQKDDGLKQKDPNALTKAQAKEYFEQTAKTLKFLTADTTPTGTKSADYSLTENMVIEWDQALEGENDKSFLIEVPIRMASPVTALLYDGVGHFNKNIRSVQVNTSLLIEKHKGDGCLHHSVVTTVGTYSKAPANIKYAYMNDKKYFSGYIIYSSEIGLLHNLFYYENGFCREVFIGDLITSRSQKIDGLGNDLPIRGLCFSLSQAALTKGGGGTSSGEDNLCPYCFHSGLTFNQMEQSYSCSYCGVILYFIEYSLCPDCYNQYSSCSCICVESSFFKKDCKCKVGEDELCPECGLPGCNKRCLQGIGGNIPYCETCEVFAPHCHCGQYTFCKTCGQINNCLCNGSGGNN